MVDGSTPEPAEMKRAWYKRWWVWAIGAFVVLVVIAGVTGGSENSEDSASDTTVAAPHSTSTTPATQVDENTTTAPTSTTEVPTTTTTTPTTTTSTLPPVLAEGSGSGDDVVDIEIPDVAAIVTFTYKGSSNFTVWSLDQDYETIDLLVNTIGSYEGTRPIQFIVDDVVTGFDISGSGDWTYLIAPLSEADAYNCPLAGEGDDVILVRDFAGSGGSASLTFDADTNFAIWAWGADSRDLIVNQIGPYEGTVRVTAGQIVWDITGNEGSWTIDCG